MILGNHKRENRELNSWSNGETFVEKGVVFMRYWISEFRFLRKLLAVFLIWKITFLQRNPSIFKNEFYKKVLYTSKGGHIWFGSSVWPALMHDFIKQLQFLQIKVIVSTNLEGVLSWNFISKFVFSSSIHLHPLIKYLSTKKNLNDYTHLSQ